MNQQLTSTQRKILYSILSGTPGLCRLIARLNRLIETERLKSRLGLTVQTGIFKGMKYPFLFSDGSVLYPKLLGSYEYELHDVLRKFLSKKYDSIIDIGAAEGYYAVGCALHNKAKIIAYETDETARQFINEMATLNGVEITIRGTCDSLEKTDNSLIICDVEGAENDLFDNQIPFKDSDLIIELHDFIREGTEKRMLDKFKQTHQVSLIKVGSREGKYESILKGLGPEAHYMALLEHRPYDMKWLVCERKTA